MKQIFLASLFLVLIIILAVVLVIVLLVILNRGAAAIAGSDEDSQPRIMPDGESNGSKTR